MAMKRCFIVESAARTGNDAQVAVPILGGLQMSDDAPRWAAFSFGFFDRFELG